MRRRARPHWYEDWGLRGNPCYLSDGGNLLPKWERRQPKIITSTQSMQNLMDLPEEGRIGDGIDALSKFRHNKFTCDSWR
jgi:hypothetical protein